MTIGWLTAIILGLICAGTAIAYALIQIADAYDGEMDMGAEEGGDE